MKYFGAIDQGTTSSRFIVFSENGNIISQHQQEFKQYLPNEVSVEHDPIEIWESVKNCINEVDKNFSISQLSSIGITNQRETTVLWDKKTGKPVYKAIVWQDRRQEEFCKKLRKQNKDTMIFNKTGLLIDSYFSGTKIKWILENVPKAKTLMKNKQLMFGTIDSFLIWRLTKGKVHATDATNASRTCLLYTSPSPRDG